MIDKTSDGLSALLAHAIVKVIVACFVLFINLGIAFWIGDMLGEIYYGFFIIAAFYALVAFILYFYMRIGMKSVLYDYLVKQMLMR